jgi:UDP-glucose 4-epimerase
MTDAARRTLTDAGDVVVPRRVIVTGGAGFVGSHLVRRLVAEGDAVLVIDDLSSGTIDHLPAEVSLEHLDIASDDLVPIFRAWQPEIVFHLAAQASVTMSHRAPLRDLAVNVGGTNRVAAATAEAAGRRIVFVSSGGAIYGETCYAATEEAPAAPASYYGIHKLAAEGHVSLAGLPYAIARPSNIYGPWQAAGLEGAVVAAFIEQALASGALQVHGDGRQTRDFVHVDDVVEALHRLGRVDGPVGTWNVASGRSTSIVELATVVEGAFGRRLTREFSAPRVGDVQHSALAADRLRSLGWRPTTTLLAGVRALVQALDPPPAAADAHADPPVRPEF